MLDGADSGQPAEHAATDPTARRKRSVISKVEALDMQSGQEWMGNQTMEDSPVAVTEVVADRLQLLAACSRSVLQPAGSSAAPTLGYRRPGGWQCNSVR